MTIEEFGQSIKKKYPQYGSMNDHALGKRVLGKYPQYRSLISIKDVSPGITEENLKTKGLLGKVGSFLGIEKVARRAGFELAKLDPEHRKVLERLDPETKKQLETGGVTAKQAVGSAALAGLTIALPFSGKLIRPAGASFKSLLVRGALTGSMFGAAGAVEEGMEANDIKNSAMLGAVVGSAFPLMSKTLSGAGRFLKGVPRRLYNTVFKAEKDQLRRELTSEARGKDFITDAEWALQKEKIVGGFESLAKETIRRLDTAEAVIRKTVLRPGASLIKIDKGKFLPPLRQIQKRYIGATFTGTGTEAQQLINTIKKAPGGKISQKTALDLKRFLDRLRNRPSFKMDQQLGPIQEDLKVAADTVRNTLKEVNPTIARELERESHLMGMLEDLVEQAVKDRNVKLLNLTDIILGGGGMASGFPGSGFGLAALVRIGQRPEVVTRMAQGLQKTLNFQQKVSQGKLPRRLGTFGNEMAKGARQIYFGEIGQ